ncbi:unnamed protein product [Enterobius vermicularis]|uniref:Sporulation protein YhbH n=1 Tax=Enterobius vermicularis TaxID=51028 RepID=A0A0N4V9L7_ENTVE|nr:unnamed protein product [Enterobius vermicularis]
MYGNPMLGNAGKSDAQSDHFRIRKTIDRLDSRLKEYLTTVDESARIPRKRTESEKLIKELKHDKRHFEDVI